MSTGYGDGKKGKTSWDYSQRRRTRSKEWQGKEESTFVWRSPE